MARVVLVDILSILFGLGTWVCVNGLWVELPLFVQVLPEGWSLPSFLAVIIQIANVGPLSYSILNSFFPNVITEKRTIYFTILVGSVSTFLVTVFWKSTSRIFGEEHSTGLLVLVLFMGIVDCSSRVLYLPFMSKFKEMYLTSFFIGEGLSAFVPSIFALVQGVGGNPECSLVNVTDGNTTTEKYEPYSPPPLFSVEVFFYFLFANVIISAIAFHLLNYKSIAQKALSVVQRPRKNSAAEIMFSETPLTSPEIVQIVSYESMSQTDCLQVPELLRAEPEIEIGKRRTIENNNILKNGTASRTGSTLPKSLLIHVLTIQVIACVFSNGVFPSIQSYSCLPYGNVAYHFVATLSTMANPAVCLLLFVIPPPTKKSITTAFSLAILVSAYVLTTAIESPRPPLQGQTVGEVLLVVSWVLLVSFFTYVKVSVATILRSDGKRGLFWCGAITQFGSATGAIVTFFIVNYTTIFESYNACQSI